MPYVVCAFSSHLILHGALPSIFMKFVSAVKRDTRGTVNFGIFNISKDYTGYTV